MEERTRKRVVILGGGFAGVYTAQQLEKALGGRDDFEIVLVNKENYFVFQPMLAEVVAELNDFVRGVARSYPQIDPAEIRVVLLHGRDRILPEVTEKLGLFAQKILRKHGVEIRLNTRLQAATGDEAVL